MIDQNTLLSMYCKIMRIRMVEEKIVELYPEQEMRCPVHLCIGQEAVPVGVCANLTKEDYVMSNHRSHGHYLAKGGDMKALFAEIYGKATGCSKGKGGSMHLVDLSVNLLGTTPIVAGSIPIGVGVAFGTLLKGENRVTAVFFGDAATEEGVFSECLNFAALKKLPVLFVCENNLYSVYSPLGVRQPHERNNLSIANAYGIVGAKGDGNNVLEIYELVKKAVMYVRQGQGPYYLEFDTYRWREHCGPNYDNVLGYRDEAEFIKWQQLCPVEGYEKMLLKEGVLNKQAIANITTKIELEINEAVAFAKKSPFPDIEQMLAGVYSGGQPEVCSL